MGRVFLIRPRWDLLKVEENYAYNRIFFPLSLAYCASLLKFHDIHAVHLDFHGMRKLDVQNEISDIRPEDIVFVTSSDVERWVCPHLDLEPLSSTVDLIRQRTEHVYVMGPHGTMDSEMILRLTRATAVIRGEPENTVLRLARQECLDSIPGISYAAGEQVIHNPDCEDIDLDRLPFPDFSLLKHANYRYEIMGDRHVILESTRNCPFSCTFCYKGMYGKKYRLKSVQRVIEEIRSAMRTGARRGTFIDLDIGINRAHLVDLCRAIRENVPGFEWCCQTRVENLDEEIISLTSRAGCRLIGFGVETADRKRLGSLKKNVDIQQVKQVLMICRRYGIQTLCFLFVGFPLESLEEAQHTIDLGLQLRPTYLATHLVTGFKGTPFYDTTEADDSWYHLEPSAKKRNQLKKMIRAAYMKHYLRFSSLKERFAIHGLRGSFSRVKLFLNYLR